jgi:hypothetical protein
MLKKKIWDNFKRIIEVFTQKIFTELLKILVWEQRSVIRKKPIPDPGSRGQKGTESRIGIRNTGIYMRSTRSDLLNNVGMRKKVPFKDFSFYPNLVVTIPKNNMKLLSI